MVVRFRKQAFKFLQKSTPSLAAEIQQQLNQIDTAIGPHTEVEYESLVELLDRLIDQIGEDESHPLASMMDVIGVLIENYETEHMPELTE